MRDPDLLKGKDREEEPEEFHVPPLFGANDVGEWDDLEVDP